MPAKYYYFIEDLDITADNIPDGILVRQCKLDIKKNLIIYNKNLYLSDKTLSLIINDITDVNDKKAHKPILLSNKVINEIKNKIIEFERLPRVIISKKSDFAHLLHNKNININKLVKKLNEKFI